MLHFMRHPVIVLWSWPAAVKRHNKRLRHNTLVGTSLAPPADGLLNYPSNMASLKSNMAANDDVIKSHVPGCVNDNGAMMYSNAHVASTLDRQKVTFLNWHLVPNAPLTLMPFKSRFSAVWYISALYSLGLDLINCVCIFSKVDGLMMIWDSGLLLWATLYSVYFCCCRKLANNAVFKRKNSS